jgi:hypothetical protein
MVGETGSDIQPLAAQEQLVRVQCRAEGEGNQHDRITIPEPSEQASRHTDSSLKWSPARSAYSRGAAESHDLRALACCRIAYSVGKLDHQHHRELETAERHDAQQRCIEAAGL